ncbi:WLM domain-containing protein [Cerioporus squamosus]|nr:WLM domain-containing protein [Cerioporus squamosus]
MPDVFVKSLTHLKDRPRADQALRILQRIASLVKPIMRKRAWVLPVLSEFFPESPNLLGLNINAGEKILLRLRPPHAPDTFYDEEDILHTMLHEFYKYLADLEEEHAALRRSGYDGEGFIPRGTDWARTSPMTSLHTSPARSPSKRREAEADQSHP